MTADYEMGFIGLTHIFRLCFRPLLVTKQSKVYVRRDREMTVICTIMRTSKKTYRVIVTGYASGNHKAVYDEYRSFRYLYELCSYLNTLSALNVYQSKRG